MKKVFKIIGWVFLSAFILVAGYGVYTYQSSPFLKAIVNNDESALFYSPVKEMQLMQGLEFSENVLKVENSISIYTYQFKLKTEAKANIFLIKGNGGNISTNLEVIKPLVENGFSVYSLDWRGYGKSNGVPNYKGVMLDTEKAFIDFLNKTANDSVKTIVYGMSLGGQLAIKITKDNQDKVDVLILDGSIASAQSFLLDNVDIGFLRNRIKDAPENYNQDYIGIRDIAEIDNIPKLIIHSKSDRAVPFGRGKNIFDASKEPKELWETNTKHIRTLTDLTDEAIEKINQLIQ